MSFRRLRYALTDNWLPLVVGFIAGSVFGYAVYVLAMRLIVAIVAALD